MSRPPLLVSGLSFPDPLQPTTADASTETEGTSVDSTTQGTKAEIKKEEVTSVNSATQGSEAEIKKEVEKAAKDAADKKFKSLLYPRKPKYPEPTHHAKDILTGLFKLFIGLPFFCFFGVILLCMKATGVAAEVAVDSVMDAKDLKTKEYVFWPDFPKEDREELTKKFKNLDMFKIFHPLADGIAGIFGKEVKEENMTLSGYNQIMADSFFEARNGLAESTVNFGDVFGINKESAEDWNNEMAKKINDETVENKKLPSTIPSNPNSKPTDKTSIIHQA